jgi:hypothetical protein
MNEVVAVVTEVFFTECVNPNQDLNLDENGEISKELIKLLMK